MTYRAQGVVEYIALTLAVLAFLAVPAYFHQVLGDELGIAIGHSLVVYIVTLTASAVIRFVVGALRGDSAKK